MTEWDRLRRPALLLPPASEPNTPSSLRSHSEMISPRTLLYVDEVARCEDLAEIHALMRDARLANLVTATAEGLVATSLPFVLDEVEGPWGTLYGHLARANGQWRAAPFARSWCCSTVPTPT